MNTKIRPKQGEQVELQIEKTISGGLGLARHSEYGVILVEKGLTDEVVLSEIVDIKRDLAFAKIVNIVQASPQRVTPSCDLYTVCGGCDFMHLNHSAQLHEKQQWAIESFARFANITFPEPPTIHGELEWHYRRRFQFHHDTKSKTLGLKASKSNDIVSLTQCPVAHHNINTYLSHPTLLEKSRERFHVIAADEKLLLSTTDDSATIKIGKYSYHTQAQLFFQSYPGIFAKIIDEILAFAPTSGQALDLYAGVGLFSLPLLNHGLKVVAVEKDRRTKSYILKNVAKNLTPAEQENFHSLSLPVEDFKTHMDIDFILVDPPRTGLSPTAKQKILDLKPKKLVYISCQCDNLARDAGFFVSHNAKLEKLMLFDTSPQTSHFESVAFFSFD